MMLNKFKDILHKQKDEINLFIANHSYEIDHLGDETDAIQAKILARSNAQIVARNKDNLLRIDFALKKIADGSFGICCECSEEISEKRLSINPAFNVCVGCSERLELLRKNQGR